MRFFSILNIPLLFLLTSHAFGSIHYLRPKKTGSTTLSFLLRKHIDPKHLYCEGKKNLVLANDFSEAQRKLNTMRDIREDDVVIGHFPMWFFEQKVKHDADCFWFVTLRDPIERVLSQFRYMRKRGLTTQSPCDIQPNHMCRILSSDPELSDQGLLESAISNLHKMDMIIFLEDFEYGVRQLFNELNLPQPDVIPKRNSTSKAPVHPLVIEKLRKIHSLDILLYEYARTHFGKAP